MDENLLQFIPDLFFQSNAQLIRMFVSVCCSVYHHCSQLGGNLFSTFPEDMLLGIDYLEELWFWRNPFNRLPPHLLVNKTWIHTMFDLRLV
jgi:hypothetical protein